MKKMSKETPEKNAKGRRSPTWMDVVGGNFLATDFLRRQMGLLVLLVILALFYISNRYAVQQQMIEIDKLQKELNHVKYLSLTRSSELTEQSRQSRIEEALREMGSELGVSTQPPYELK